MNYIWRCACNCKKQITSKGLIYLERRLAQRETEGKRGCTKKMLSKRKAEQERFSGKGIERERRGEEVK